jgi:hypothetical protein
MGVVTLLGRAETERRVLFTRLMRDEADALQDVENTARRLLRAEREKWMDWLLKDVREELWAALGRLDTTRARLAVLREENT